MNIKASSPRGAATVGGRPKTKTGKKTSLGKVQEIYKPGWISVSRWGAVWLLIRSVVWSHLTRYRVNTSEGFCHFCLFGWFMLKKSWVLMVIHTVLCLNMTVIEQLRKNDCGLNTIKLRGLRLNRFCNHGTVRWQEVKTWSNENSLTVELHHLTEWKHTTVYVYLRNN